MRRLQSLNCREKKQSSWWKKKMSLIKWNWFKTFLKMQWFLSINKGKSLLTYVQDLTWWVQRESKPTNWFPPQWHTGEGIPTRRNYREFTERRSIKKKSLQIIWSIWKKSKRETTTSWVERWNYLLPLMWLDKAFPFCFRKEPKWSWNCNDGLKIWKTVNGDM